jgi:hypothetical protein
LLPHFRAELSASRFVSPGSCLHDWRHPHRLCLESRRLDVEKEKLAVQEHEIGVYLGAINVWFHNDCRARFGALACLLDALKTALASSASFDTFATQSLLLPRQGLAIIGKDKALP